MQIDVPDAHLTNQWKLGAGHILVGSVKDAAGKRRFNDHPYGILGTETFMILHALDVLGLHGEAADGLDQWLTLPMNPTIVPGQAGHHTWAQTGPALGTLFRWPRLYDPRRGAGRGRVITWTASTAWARARSCSP